MNVKAINSMNYMTRDVSFKHTAVPYPEYEDAYYRQAQPSSLTKIADKISSLFTPEVTQKSQEIKEGINKIYDEQIQDNYFESKPQKHLLSVLA